MDDNYKWIALSNTTLGVLLATLDASITLIAMPDIFRGIHLDPLVPSNSFYLLWMILGYMVVASVLIVSLGRLGDIFGRVKIYNLGFLISVPVGVFGTVWAYLKLEERSEPRRRPIDWWGNVTFAVGLICAMVAITYGIRPYGSHATGWGSLKVVALLASSVVFLAAFGAIEKRAPDPMFRLDLFRIRAFTFGSLSTFLSAVARGGLLFILIIWLQGLWLPQHGYSFTETPLWAGIYMLPLTVGMLVAGPTSGYLSDRFGARGFATGGMLGAALSFGLLLLLPIDFSYPLFAVVLLLNGVSMGLFASPNRAAVMNSLPRGDRGARGAMNQTFQNSAQVLSIGIFFTLMIIGLAATLPAAMSSGLEAHGVSQATAQHVAHLPPVSILFAAFLGYNPVQHLVGPHALAALSAQDRG